MTFLKNFVRDEQGQDLIEYALLLAFMVIAGATALSSVDDQLKLIWNGTSGALTNAQTGTAAS